MAPLRSLSVALSWFCVSCIACEVARVACVSCLSCCLSAPFASMPYLAHLGHGGHLQLHLQVVSGIRDLMERWCLQRRGFNLNGPPWEEEAATRAEWQRNGHRKFSQIGCGSRRNTSTRVWGATQGLRSTNWATRLEGVGGSCTFQRVGLSLPTSPPAAVVLFLALSAASPILPTIKH
jgi:hypothetical protein